MTEDKTIQCSHGIVFDLEEVKKMKGGAMEVRTRYPRGYFTAENPCSTCGFVGIAYASEMHYLYGDW